MHIIDGVIFLLYMLAMIGVGVYFLKTNSSTDDYYVGGRNIGCLHIGFSVVATDVGGGFSIGLGGLGFVMGLSGSWMLFTGLLGAWVSAVFLIPKVKRMGMDLSLLTFPQIFGKLYGAKVAFIAAIISGLGYIGFTSSQILAGAKLASASFPSLDVSTAVIVMGCIALIYTVIGGLKAVIYTDTIQWAILMFGLIFIGIPLAYQAIGGYEVIVKTLGHTQMLSFSNVSWVQLVNWSVTIIPIWFVGMTLYQRIYAARDVKQAKRAWFIAGLLEWPVMAIMGVLLGLFARVAYEQGMFVDLGYAPHQVIDEEMGLPLLLRTVLPVGLMGVMMAAYFSAIMSTADSCLMAASGNVVTDLIQRILNISERQSLKLSQWTTLVIGGLAIFMAYQLDSVIDVMLDSYAFMVSGLFVPVIGAFYWSKSSSVGALASMLGGGSTTLVLLKNEVSLPLGLNENIAGICVAAALFVVMSLAFPDRKKNTFKLKYS